MLAAQLSGPDPRVADDDFQVFYQGAATIAAGRSPYQGDFVSPPWFALAVAPLTVLPLLLARGLWLALNLALLLAATALAAACVGLRWHARQVALAAALYALWPPVEFGLRLGQNSVLVWTLTLAALRAAQTERYRWSGALLALGLVKPQLVWLFGLGLLVRAARQGRLRSLLFTAAAVMALAALAVALVAPDSYADLLAGRPHTWRYWESTVALPPLLAGLSGSPFVGIMLYLPVAALGAAVVVRQWATDADLAYLAALTACATLLLTPYAYPYDALLLALPLLWLAAESADLARAHPRCAAGVVAIVVAALLALERPADYEPSRFLGLLPPLGLLAALVLLRRSRRLAAASEPSAAG